MVGCLKWTAKTRVLFLGLLLAAVPVVALVVGQQRAAALDLNPCDGAAMVGCFVDDAIGGGGGGAQPSITILDIVELIFGGGEPETEPPPADPEPEPQQDEEPWEDRAAEDAAYCPGVGPHPQPPRCQ